MKRSVAAINERHENPDYLPGIELPATVTATHDPEHGRRRRRRRRLAVPSQSLRENLVDWAPVLARGAAGLADEGRRARHA